MNYSSKYTNSTIILKNNLFFKMANKVISEIWGFGHFFLPWIQWFYKKIHLWNIHKLTAALLHPGKIETSHNEVGRRNWDSFPPRALPLLQHHMMGRKPPAHSSSLWREGKDETTHLTLRFFWGLSEELASVSCALDGWQDQHTIDSQDYLEQRVQLERAS